MNVNVLHHTRPNMHRPPGVSDRLGDQSGVGDTRTPQRGVTYPALERGPSKKPTARGRNPLRTAQAAMRHSDPSLTANVYTDPKLLDVARAVASLPDLPLGKVVQPA